MRDRCPPQAAPRVRSYHAMVFSARHRLTNWRLKRACLLVLPALTYQLVPYAPATALVRHYLATTKGTDLGDSGSVAQRAPQAYSTKGKAVAVLPSVPLRHIPPIAKRWPCCPACLSGTFHQGQGGGRVASVPLRHIPPRARRWPCCPACLSGIFNQGQSGGRVVQRAHQANVPAGSTDGDVEKTLHWRPAMAHFGPNARLCRAH